MFAAVIPALLLYTLLFMETHICELIMMEKTKEKKGAGLHLDIVLLSLINLVSGAIGGPWICAATVRAVSHVSALTVMSTTHVPGEAPKVVGIRDQRLTAFSVSVLLGVSVLLAPSLKLVPFAAEVGLGHACIAAAMQSPFVEPGITNNSQLAFLTVVYGVVLYQASGLISTGSEMLQLVPSIAGIVGSIVLPILGAAPDGVPRTLRSRADLA